MMMNPTRDGDDELVLMSAGGLEGSQYLADIGMTYFAKRGDRGWVTEAMSPSAADFPSIHGLGATDWSSDFKETLWVANLPEDIGSRTYAAVIQDRYGSHRIAGPRLTDPSGAYSGSGAYVGGSSDLRTLVFASRSRPELADGLVDGRGSTRESLIVVKRADDGSFTVKPVAHQGGAAMFSTCAVALGNRSGLGAVSRDGSKIFFSTTGLSSCTGAAMQRVWAKVDDNDPIDLSAPQCNPMPCGGNAAVAIFEGASDDGDRVYFSTEQKLLNIDGDASLGRDLYEYDFSTNGGTLRAVTSSADSVGAGVVGVSRVSADGSRVYFVATGRPLTTVPNERQEVPEAGKHNLYVYHRDESASAGDFTFIGAVSSSDSQVFGADSNRKAQVTDDGRYFAFVSSADVAGDRLPGDSQPDLYRYAAEDDELSRIWPSAPEVNGTARTGGVILTTCECGSANGARNKALRSNSYMSQDGAIVGFDTDVALNSDDKNSTVDTYVWSASSDAIHLVTSGRSPVNSGIGFVSRSGDSIGFSSAAPLVPEHTSGQTATYVLRRGGGFAPKAPDPDPCVGEQCQGPLMDQPVLPGIATYFGPGNGEVLPTAPRRTAQILKMSAAQRSSAARTGMLSVPVRVSGAGRVTISATALVGAKKNARKKHQRVGRTARSVPKSGRINVRVRLSSRARNALRWHGRLVVTVKADPGGSETRVVLRRAVSKGKK